MTAKLRELAIVAIVAVALAVVMTWPMVPNLGRLGRVDNNDGQLSIWNVSWVARTLIVDPIHVFDANIFYPHKRTLAYSESNIGAGILAIPGYWATRNAFAAHNSVVLIGFVLLPLLWILNAIFVIIAAIQASDGKFYRYPMTIRFIQ